MNDQVLFVGAHADDIEIGAGGTLRRLVQQGCRVSACILTREHDDALAMLRRREALEAMRELGVEAGRVHFLDRPDGALSADGASVAALRHLVQAMRIAPALVFTHSRGDSHNDHRAAADLVLAAFRATPLLHFGVVNSLVASAFAPRLFVDIDAHRAAKLQALARHASQDRLGRLQRDRLDALERQHGRQIDAAHAEAFELSLQLGADGAGELLQSLNDSPFHAFWHALLRDRPLAVACEVPRWHGPGAPRDRHPLDTREALSQLRKAFGRHGGFSAGLDEYGSDRDDIDALFGSSDVLLEGGPATNRLVAATFDALPQLRYRIDEAHGDPRIEDTLSGRCLRGDYEAGRDLGLLSLVRHPLHAERWLIGCMGLHAEGSAACIRLLADPAFLRRLQRRAGPPFSREAGGWQMLVHVECQSRVALPDWASLAEFRATAAPRSREAHPEYCAALHAVAA